MAMPVAINARQAADRHVIRREINIGIDKKLIKKILLFCII
jgi:hypothetical protein